MAYTFTVIGNEASPGPSTVNATATTVAATDTFTNVWAQVGQYVDRMAQSPAGVTVPGASRLVELFNELDSLFASLKGIAPGTFT